MNLVFYRIHKKERIFLWTCFPSTIQIRLDSTNNFNSVSAAVKIVRKVCFCWFLLTADRLLLILQTAFWFRSVFTVTIRLSVCCFLFGIFIGTQKVIAMFFPPSNKTWISFHWHWNRKKSPGLNYKIFLYFIRLFYVINSKKTLNLRLRSVCEAAKNKKAYRRHKQ